MKCDVFRCDICQQIRNLHELYAFTGSEDGRTAFVKCSDEPGAFAAAVRHLCGACIRAAMKAAGF